MALIEAGRGGDPIKAARNVDAQAHPSLEAVRRQRMVQTLRGFIHDVVAQIARLTELSSGATGPEEIEFADRIHEAAATYIDAKKTPVMALRYLTPDKLMERIAEKSPAARSTEEHVEAAAAPAPQQD